MNLKVIATETHQPFAKFTSDCVVLPQKDIDTDMIIPANHLTTTKQGGLGAYLFENLKKSDPNFPAINGQRILITGKNFGCGSSREHAVWTIKEAGVDVVIASEFGDIFRGNAEKNGLLTIVLSEDIVQKLMASPALTIDLENQEIQSHDNETFSFHIPDFARNRLLYNMSDMDYLQGKIDEIKRFSKNS